MFRIVFLPFFALIPFIYGLFRLFTPFFILGYLVLGGIYNIHKTKAEQANDKDHLEAVEKLKTEFIDKNKLGVATGEGFYKYPNPEFRNEDFLK